MILKKQAQAISRAAFTLMEMLVVVAILVVLAGAAVPIYLSYLDGARKDRAKIDIKNLEGAVEAHIAKYGMPQNGWNDLLAQPGPGERPALDQEKLKDPWGGHYVLDVSQLHPTRQVPKIYTQTPGGAMISNW